MDKEEYTFDGFVFANKDDLELAKQEKKKIEYILSHTDMSNISVVKGLYEKALETKSFSTPVGLIFMHGLRDRLISVNYYKEEEIPPVPLYTTFRRIDFKDTGDVKKRVTKAEKKEQDLKLKYRNSLLISGVLLVLVIVMFVITMNGSNINAMNYRRAVTNEYAAWEQELTERESVIREKEKELGIFGN